MKKAPRKDIYPCVGFFSEDYGFLGHLLRSERLIQKLSLHDVANELNLSTYIIKNLERGFFDGAPGISYMIGFSRTYATYLGLNWKEISDYVQPATQESLFEEESVIKFPLQKKHVPSKFVLLLSMISLFFIGLGYVVIKLNTKKESSITLAALSSPVELENSKASTILSDSNLTDDTFNKNAAATEQIQKPQENYFYVCFSADTWIILKDSQGKIIRQGVLHQGDYIQLPMDFDGRLNTGNAGGMYIKYGNITSPSLGFSGQVIKNFHINLKKILHNL